MWQTWLEVGGQFNTFLSISLLFFVEGGQSLSKLDGGMTGFVPLDPPLILIVNCILETSLKCDYHNAQVNLSMVSSKTAFNTLD